MRVAPYYAEVRGWELRKKCPWSCKDKLNILKDLLDSAGHLSLSCPRHDLRQPHAYSVPSEGTRVGHGKDQRVTLGRSWPICCAQHRFLNKKVDPCWLLLCSQQRWFISLEPVEMRSNWSNKSHITIQIKWGKYNPGFWSKDEK